MRRFFLFILCIAGCEGDQNDTFTGDVSDSMQHSESASTHSNETSVGESSVGETSGENTESWTAECGVEPCLRIVPGMKVCRLFGRFLKSQTDFTHFVDAQSEISFDSGIFPFDAVSIRGELQTGSTHASFWSESLIEAKLDQAGTDGVLLTTHAPPIPVESDAGPFDVTFTLTPVRDGTNRHFTLDNFDKLDPDIDAKEVFDLNSPLLGEPIMQMRFDSCDMEGTPDDLFHFTFENGDWLDVTVRSRLHKYGIRVQAGVVRHIVGQVEGVSIDSTNRFEIFHSTRHNSDDLVTPSFIALFSEHEGHCGIALRARLGDPTYEAFYLDCAYQKSDPLKLIAVDYPAHYRESWDE